MTTLTMRMIKGGAFVRRFPITVLLSLWAICRRNYRFSLCASLIGGGKLPFPLCSYDAGSRVREERG
jgi:hypothetical protein